MEQKYCDILLAAEHLCTAAYSPNKECITRIATFYWACILYHRHMLGSIEHHDHIYDEAMSNLAAIVFSRYEEDRETRRLSRMVWPTYIGAVETSDPIHRAFFLNSLRESQTLSAECRWMYEMAEERVCSS
jgi:hypothetical protein